MLYVYGLLTATVAIVVAEIVGNYGLGDLLKDLVLRLLHGGEVATDAAVARLNRRAAKIKAAL